MYKIEFISLLLLGSAVPAGASASPLHFAANEIVGARGCRVSNPARAGGALFYGSTTAVTGIGDVNRDGHDDVAVAVHGGDGAGEVAIVFGPVCSRADSTGVVDVRNLDGQSGFILHGHTPGARLGYSLARLGDVNGDGIDDFGVGALGVNAAQLQSAGKVYIVYGRTTFAAMRDVDVETLLGTTVFVGEHANDQVGWNISSAGDFNGDGRPDLAISSNAIDGPGQIDVGATYVFLGRAGGLGTNLSSSTAFLTVRGNITQASLGFVAKGVGDLNDDGFDDLAIASHDILAETSEVFVVLGPTGGQTLVLPSAPSPSAFAVGFGAIYRWAGTAISGGDFDGDQVSDFVVGTPTSRSPYRPYAVVLRGRAGLSGYTNPTQTTSDEHRRIDGFAGERFGEALTALDFNGDGRDDLAFVSETRLLVAPGRGWGELSNGQARLAPDSPHTITAVEIDGGNLHGNTGFGVGTDHTLRSAGDVNGDGLEDLIIGIGAGAMIVHGISVHLGTIGEDAIGGGERDDIILGQWGDDILHGGPGADEIDGDMGDDVLRGDDGDDLLRGGQGHDHLYGGGGLDTADYSHTSGIVVNLLGVPWNYSGSATLDAGSVLDGEGGIDQLSSVEGIIATESRDLLNGSNIAPNHFDARGGDDYVIGGAMEDHLIGGSGDDEMLGHGGDDLLEGGLGDDSLGGSAGDDTILGGPGNDSVRGAGGDDVLEGGDGDDVLQGQDGDDTLDGGPGFDYLYGGAGADTFIISSQADAFGARDSIQDLETPMIGLDRIDLRPLLESLGYVRFAGNIRQWVAVRVDAQHAYLMVDRDGLGLAFGPVDVVRLRDRGDLTLEALLSRGVLRY